MKKEMLAEIRSFFEKSGIYIFFSSLTIFTQFRWIKRHESIRNLELKIVGAFLFGLLAAFIIFKIIEYFTFKSKIRDKEQFLKNLSLSLSPGMFFLLTTFKSGFLVIGIVLCIFCMLYVPVEPFREFIKLLVYTDRIRNDLTIKDSKAVIKVIGRYEKGNPEIMQHYLSDLAINFHECIESKIKEVDFDISLYKAQKEELKKIIESVAGYFDIKVSYLSTEISLISYENEAPLPLAEFGE